MNSNEMTDEQLKQAAGGSVQTNGMQQICPNCGKSYGIVVMTSGMCPYCGYRQSASNS